MDETSAGREFDGGEFAVVHALRIKGFAAVECVAAIACLDAATVRTVLQGLVARGLARHNPARDLYQLLPPGRDRHAELLAAVPAEAVAALRRHYEAFRGLNTACKELCTAWQLRGGEPNDHTDAGYDAALIGELAALHRRVVPVVVALAAAVPRFDADRHRLTTALGRATAGDRRMFTGVMCGSYHDVCMELHEDLIQLLGIDRQAEGSF